MHVSLGGSIGTQKSLSIISTTSKITMQTLQQMVEMMMNNHKRKDQDGET